MNTIRLRIATPFVEEAVSRLRCGDEVLLSGVVYSARDAAHKRMAEALTEGRELPFDLSGQAIYYMGPSPTPPGRVIGAAGPTTSGRMDAYTPSLLAAGLKGMIGKGRRSAPVIAAMRQHRAVYFAADGGAGALLSRCITAAEVIAYHDLGPEALRRLELCDMPLVVAIDIRGEDIYERGPQKYRKIVEK